MRFASIGSGSEGNGTLVAHDDGGCVLLDCGFSGRETVARLRERGLTPDDLAGILVTHEHTDHVRGVARLANRWRLPVYCTWGTFAGKLNGDLDETLLQLINPGEPFTLAGMHIVPVAVPHDAREPCQFVFSTPQFRLGVLTDAGSISRQMVAHYQHCDALMLECNHDLQMLAEGPYPASLKRRVAGALGHLNNRQAAELLVQVGHAQMQHLIVSHISQTNNRPELAVQVLGEARPDLAGIIRVADQRNGLDWCALQPSCVLAPSRRASVNSPLVRDLET